MDNYCTHIYTHTNKNKRKQQKKEKQLYSTERIKMAAITTTTTIYVPPKMEEKMESLHPFEHAVKIGKEMSDDILHQIKGDGSNGKRFKINLYPASLKPSCRGIQDGKDLPQRNESYYYSSQPVGTKYFFYGPLRKFNKATGQFDTYGAYRTRWYIDSADWSLHQADYGSTFKWHIDEYCVVLEPFQRAWNHAVIDVDANGPIHSNRSSQFSAFSTRNTHKEEMGTALLKRKHENQSKRKRSKTPPSTFSKKRRNNILAHTTMQRLYTTAKLKHGNKMVFVNVGNYIHTYSNDALKLARNTDLHVHYAVNDWAPPQVVFPKKKLVFYAACCNQKGMQVVLV